MCGIFGVVVKAKSPVSADLYNRLVENLYTQSQSRGMESAGLHLYVPIDGLAWSLKAATSASQLIKSKEYRQVLNQHQRRVFSSEKSLPTQASITIAHSRLVTNGTASIAKNNQPLKYAQVEMVHNGIIVNVDSLWNKHQHLGRRAEVDTEIMAARLNDCMQQSLNAVDATKQVYAEIEGAASIAWVHEQTGELVLASNTGDLYYLLLPGNQGLIFASERHILNEALKDLVQELGITSYQEQIQWLEPKSGLIVDSTSNAAASLFGINETLDSVDTAAQLTRDFQHQDVELKQKSSRSADVMTSHQDESLLHYDEDRVKSIKRCSRCVLPETFPFIAFDEKGVCNYCNSYKPRYEGMHATDNKEAFFASLERYRREGNSPDVLVPFSGGRDSSYGLHIINKEFGFKPITFTYDWGMVTDLARRNIARMCGQLGVQNILVSADIHTKRANVRKNVSAWLKKPDLGMVPLFMAGDKHFFKIVNQLKKQTGIRLDLWSANPLENTDFKSGFCGVSPDFDKSRVDYLSLSRKARLAAYYASRFATNPRYLNGSLIDTFGAFLAYYFEPRRDFYFIFDHFIWNESEVDRVLLNDYDWETAADTSSTWRIGDGTAPFYNYIYNTAQGFSEFDTFRSNQIREGMLTREQAMASIVVENRPRAESMRWYLDAIGLDFNTVVRRINEMRTT